jgi:hypothetical protein
MNFALVDSFFDYSDYRIDDLTRGNRKPGDSDIGVVK